MAGIAFGAEGNSSFYDRLVILKGSMLVEATNRRAPLTRGQYVPNKAFTVSMAPEFSLLNDVMAGSYSKRYPYDPRPLLQAISVEYSSPDVKGNAQKALDALEADRAAMEDLEDRESSHRIDQLMNLIKTASAASDLDRLIAEFRVLPVHSVYDVVSQRANEIYLLNFNALQVARPWQDYLAHCSAKQWRQATIDLELYEKIGLEKKMVAADELCEPAAEAWRRFPSNAGILVLITNIKDLDEIQPALWQSRALLAEASPEEKRAVSVLEKFADIYASARTGLPEPIFADFPPDNSSFPNQQLTEQMRRLAMENFLGIVPTKETRNEKLEDFLNGVMVEAAKRGDARILRRVGAVETYLAPANSMNLASKVESLIAALHEEAVRQYALSVLSYKLALQQNVLPSISPMIAARLDEIHRAHPDDFAEGMAWATAANPISN